MDFISTVTVGIVSSFIASVVFTAISWFVKPRLLVSDKICVTKQQNEIIYEVKVVNKSHIRLINVDYTLTQCCVSMDGLITIENIPPKKSIIRVLEPMNKKNTEYALRITFTEEKEVLLNKSNYIEFVIQATHPITNSSVCKKAIYCSGDTFEGTFESGKSINIVTSGIHRTAAMI